MVDKKTIKELYYALIHSNLNYCIPVWGKTSKTNNNEIIKVQNKILEMLEPQLYNEGKIREIRLKHEILTIQGIYSVKIGIIMYKRIKKNLYAEEIELRKREYIHDIREKKEFVEKKIRIERSREMIEIEGVRYWNKLPKTLKEINNLNKFKKEIKKWELSKTNEI